MKFRIILLLFCILGILTGEAKAQLFLENGKVSLSVSGGEHPNGTLLIHNTSSQSAKIKVYWEDFEYKTPYDGTKNFLPAGTSPVSANKWVTFSPQEFNIPAMGQQSVNYTVAVPDQIQEGHYGVLFFEKSPEKIESDQAVSLVMRVGCLFYIEPKGVAKKVVLQKFTVEKNKIQGNFSNQGTTILIPHMTYYLMDGQGLVKDRGELKKLYLPPQATASFQVSLPKDVTNGHYTLVINADLENADVVVKEIQLVIDAKGSVTIESERD